MAGCGLGIWRFGAQRVQHVEKAAFPDQELPMVGHRCEVQYAVLVVWQDESGKSIESPIVKWPTQHRARALTFWLRERLGVETVT